MMRIATITAMILVLAVSAMAQVSRVMSYQGILLDSGGNPVGDGNYNITFRIYNAESGGTLLWTEMDMVTTVDGYFSAQLGDTLPLNLPFSQDYYLSLQVQGDSEMPDRQKLTLSAYSARSDTSGFSMSSQTANDADLLDGLNSTDFAPSVHEHDADYVNENEPNSITSDMIVDAQIMNVDISSVANIDASKINDGSGSGLDADMLDGMNSTEFSPSVHEHDADYVNENEPNSITSDMIVDAQIMNVDISSVANIEASKINDGSGSGLDADYLDGLNSTNFASSGHNHDADYVNENQASSVTSNMITDDEIVDADISSSANISASKIADGTGSGLDADMLDGLDASSFLSTASDYGRSGVATDLYEGSSTLTNKYINNIGPDTISSSASLYMALVATSSNDGGGVSGIASSTGPVSPVGLYGSAYSSGMTATPIGVKGYATDNTGFGGTAYGGYFSTATGGLGGHIGVYGYSDQLGVYGQGGTNGVYYSGGLAGTGTKSCVVRTSRGPTLLYCQESPENWFEDFGEGQLRGGQIHVELDPLFLETVTIDNAHPMKVFVQLEGDCNGVYVSKGVTGFDVIELAKGTSSVPFSYRVVAKRAGFEDRRLDYSEPGLTDPYIYPENAGERPNPNLGSRAIIQQNSR